MAKWVRHNGENINLDKVPRDSQGRIRNLNTVAQEKKDERNAKIVAVAEQIVKKVTEMQQSPGRSGRGICYAEFTLLSSKG